MYVFRNKKQHFSFFPEEGLCDLFLSVCLHIAARQRSLLFDQRRVRPFSAGALTEHSIGPPSYYSLSDEHSVVEREREERNGEVVRDTT
jgi:hypothetical protein